MADSPQPDNQPIDEEAISEPVEVDGREQRIAQEPVGEENVMGGGEYPSPSTPPSESAPGSDEQLRREIVEKRRRVGGTKPDPD